MQLLLGEAQHRPSSKHTCAGKLGYDASNWPGSTVAEQGDYGEHQFDPDSRGPSSVKVYFVRQRGKTFAGKIASSARVEVVRLRRDDQEAFEYHINGDGEDGDLAESMQSLLSEHVSPPHFPPRPNSRAQQSLANIYRSRQKKAVAPPSKC